MLCFLVGWTVAVGTVRLRAKRLESWIVEKVIEAMAPFPRHSPRSGRRREKRQAVTAGERAVWVSSLEISVEEVVSST